MRKKLDGNEANKNMAEPSGMANERNDAQIEFEIALDPGPDLDPDGWMRERSDYWTERGEPTKLRRASRWFAVMRSILARLNPLPAARRRKRLAQATELTHEDWGRLSESALGPLRPLRPESKECGPQGAPFDRKPSPTAWRVGELMIPLMAEVPLRSVPNVEGQEQAQAPIPEAEPEATPAEAPACASRRRRP